MCYSDDLRIFRLCLKKSKKIGHRINWGGPPQNVGYANRLPVPDAINFRTVYAEFRENTPISFA